LTAILPTKERLKKSNITLERKWESNRTLAVFCRDENALLIDAMKSRGILSDALHRAAETLRGIFECVGRPQSTFGYSDRVAGSRGMSERQAVLYRLYNNIIMSIPEGYRPAVLAVCIDNELHRMDKFINGIKAVDSHLSRLYRDKDPDLHVYLDFIRRDD
jgi:hypothetical protein